MIVFVLLIPLILLASLAYALERNHRRRTRPCPPLAGSTHVQDRDDQRLGADLRSAEARSRDRGLDHSLDHTPVTPRRKERRARRADQILKFDPTMPKGYGRPDLAPRRD